MIKAEFSGVVKNDYGELCDDIHVTITPEEVNAGELAAIFNELKYRGYEYDQVETILQNIYSTDIMQRTTGDVSNSNLN